MHIITSMDHFESIFIHMERFSEMNDMMERFYPTKEQCDMMEEKLDVYFEFIMYLLATQTSPVTSTEIESIARLNRIIQTHLSLESVSQR